MITLRPARAVGAWRPFLLACLAALLALGPGAPSAALLRAEEKTVGDPSRPLPEPGLDPDPRVPTLEAAIGHGWAEDITTPADIVRYGEALAAAAPDRVRAIRYGKTHESRPLLFLVITSPGNLSRIDALREGSLRLGDPRVSSPEEAARLISAQPAFVWIAGAIHGNETSPSDALLLAAWHVAADRRPAAAELRQRVVTIIDPLQNPDGRQRFIAAFGENRGRFAGRELWARERTERWPGGRFNHYGFDMNRDWFLQSQPESRAKVAAYLRWRPQLFVDAHEMGPNASYYFAPSAEPVNPQILGRQREWLQELGRYHASVYDARGFSYTTREMFDAFYPGYGSEWPNLHGELGVLWEQAGVRGLVVERRDELLLHYREAVRHHYTSALATLRFVAQHRQGLLETYRAVQESALGLDEEGPVRHFFLLEGRRPGRAARLAETLRRNGIEVRRTTKPERVEGPGTLDPERRDRTAPAGSYLVPVGQPAGRLARSLLDRHVDMGEEFVERQIRRMARRLGDEIYDVTAWSLPLAFGVECLPSAAPGDGASAPWDGKPPAGEVRGGAARVGYLVPGTDDGVLPALAEWLLAGYRVHVIDRPLTLDGVDFPRGTFLLRTSENPPALHEAVRTAARRHALRITAASSGFVDRGAHLGGPHVHWVRPPRVLLVVDRPTRYSVGHTWYLFDEVIGYPASRVAGRDLDRVELEDFDVVILPDGGYGGRDGPSDSFTARLRQWTERGGTLVLVAGAAVWATGEKVGLLASEVLRRETPWNLRKGRPAGEKKGEEAPPGGGGSGGGSGGAGGSEVLSEPPASVPGAFLHVVCDDEEWLTEGVDPELDVLVDGSLVFRPPRPTEARRPVRFAPRDRLLSSGFAWKATLDLLAETPYVIRQARGRGNVIAFVDDPNYRAMYPAAQRLFFNAVFLGPAH